MADRSFSTSQTQQSEYQFQLDVHIRKKRQRPLFQAFGKAIYEVEWINRDGPPIVLLKIDGAKASREAFYYVNLSDHPHVLRTFGLVQSNPGSVMLLQECAAQGDLSELLRENVFKPTEKVLCKIFEQICDAMTFLAVNNVVHGDLACRNVLVFQSNPNEPKKNLVKIADFGLTRASSLYSLVDSSARTTMTIIPVRYAAPEILLDADKLNYSEKSDVYSMGVLMWEACSHGELPYSSLDNDNAVQRKKLNDERLSRPSLCGDALWTIMNKCWKQNPKDRPNFESLERRLILTQQGTSSCASSPSGPTDNSRKMSPRVANKQANQDNRIQNPRNIDSRQPSQIPLDSYQSQTRSPVNNRNTHGTIVRVPCKYCDEAVYESDVSTHAEVCSERRKSQVKAATSNKSNDTTNELIPCEYCDKPCTKNFIFSHEVNCSKNPNNRVPIINTDERRLTPSRRVFPRTGRTGINNAVFQNDELINGDDSYEDDTTLLLPKDTRRQSQSRTPYQRAASTSFESLSMDRQNNKISRLIRYCCCCCS